MKKIIIVAFALILFTDIFGQCLPVADNMIKLDSWDNGINYSDVWGYVAPNGKEYGIIGDLVTISIVDVSDPVNIVKVVDIVQGDNSSWRDYKVYSHYLYSIVDAGGNDGVVIYDLSGLTDAIPEVTRINQLDMEFGLGHNVYIDVPNARLYAVGVRGSDMCVYDLANDPGDPDLIHCYDLDTISSEANENGETFYIHDIFVRDNIAYCGHGYAGYGIWDMNDPDNVSLIGYLDNDLFDKGYVHSSWNSENDNLAVVATEVGNDTKTYLVDQSNLANITVVDTYKSPLCTDPGNLNRKAPHNPYVIGNKVVISHYHDGIQVLAMDTLNKQLERVGYYDTYPDNTDYSVGYEGNWGAYPYLPSGTILASDRKYGLFTLKFEAPVYTFVGPGTDWDTASNWQDSSMPPANNMGRVIIESNCVKSSSSKIILETYDEFTVKINATFTQN